MNIGILLSGCGVYDGAEIQESVFAMLAIEEIGGTVVPISINKPQYHVINHLTGDEMNEQRNMMIESARISRGNVTDINEIQPAQLDALVIPGGFGSAKNFTNWAFLGPEGTILPEVKLLIVNLVNIGKPIVALCVSPVVVAKALEGSNLKSHMTIGSNDAPSPYDIDSFSNAMKSIGVEPSMKTINQLQIDVANKIITAPCYMMDASILEVRNNIQQAIFALKELI